MQPGRELDALIAEKIMGQSKAVAAWREYKALLKEIKPGEISMAGMRACRLELQWTIWDEYSFFQKYSTNIRDAWDVLEKIKEEIRITYQYDEWHIYFDHEDYWTFTRGCKTLPHAICLAALRVHNIKF